MDLIVPVPHLPQPGETVLSPSHAKAPGGKGANQAVAAARAGAEVVMVGCVGRDGFGDELLEIVSAADVDTSLIDHVEAPTGIALVTVADDGENQIIVASGANMAAGHEMVSDDLLGECSTVLLQMETPLREVFTLTGRAKAAGKRVILNAAPAGPIMPETLDILIVNEGEAAVVAAEIGLEERAAGDVAQRLAQTHGLTTIVTLGAQGAVAIGPDAHWRIGSLVVQPVDSVGAGDAFSGVFAAGLDNGMELADALRCAAVAGSLTCLEHGAMPALPDAEAIDARLAELAPAEPF
ncbi:MAG: ribokinase [Rhodospirillaceae bacterium]|jgi:ribokinase|nr:ribokinase [Rhodospirillaceae bacterium]MBT6512180.1 ribokinase [Rhodospirillaceae bacterium]MBT7649005.1 ribokinase [Rhodospirillaceae bacterium]